MLTKPRGFFRFISLLLCLSFFLQQTGFAQVAGDLNIAGYISNLRQALNQDKFRPLHLRYFSYNPKDNNFKILLDRGDVKNLNESIVEDASKIMLKYFLVGVTLPNESFWVNLRPDSPQNMIDDYLAQTDVGKIMLESDLQLKKDTAKFTSPQTPEGREYWLKLYQKAEELFGSGNLTIPTLTRPWIVPGEIIISETNDSAYIYKASLKVMLEQDYLKGSMMYEFKDEKSKQFNEYSSQLIRDLIIPKLTKEINTSKRYSALRQVYYSLIMAQWFKSRFRGRGGLYSSLIDQSNLQGLTVNVPYSKNIYFTQYQKSFKDGEYNVQESVQTPFGQSIRSYFSGGERFNDLVPPRGQEWINPLSQATGRSVINETGIMVDEEESPGAIFEPGPSNSPVPLTVKAKMPVSASVVVAQTVGQAQQQQFIPAASQEPSSKIIEAAIGKLNDPEYRKEQIVKVFLPNIDKDFKVKSSGSSGHYTGNATANEVAGQVQSLLRDELGFGFVDLFEILDPQVTLGKNEARGIDIAYVPIKILGVKIGYVQRKSDTRYNANGVALDVEEHAEVDAAKLDQILLVLLERISSGKIGVSKLFPGGPTAPAVELGQKHTLRELFDQDHGFGLRKLLEKAFPDKAWVISQNLNLEAVKSRLSDNFLDRKISDITREEIEIAVFGRSNNPDKIPVAIDYQRSIQESSVRDIEQRITEISRWQLRYRATEAPLVIATRLKNSNLAGKKLVDLSFDDLRAYFELNAAGKAISDLVRLSIVIIVGGMLWKGVIQPNLSTMKDFSQEKIGYLIDKVKSTEGVNALLEILKAAQGSLNPQAAIKQNEQLREMGIEPIKYVPANSPEGRAETEALRKEGIEPIKYVPANSPEGRAEMEALRKEGVFGGSRFEGAEGKVTMGDLDVLGAPADAVINAKLVLPVGINAAGLLIITAGGVVVNGRQIRISINNSKGAPLAVVNANQEVEVSLDKINDLLKGSKFTPEGKIAALGRILIHDITEAYALQLTISSLRAQGTSEAEIAKRLKESLEAEAHIAGMMAEAMYQPAGSQEALIALSEVLKDRDKLQSSQAQEAALFALKQQVFAEIESAGYQADSTLRGQLKSYERLAQQMGVPVVEGSFTVREFNRRQFKDLRDYVGILRDNLRQGDFKNAIRNIFIFISKLSMVAMQYSVPYLGLEYGPDGSLIGVIKSNGLKVFPSTFIVTPLLWGLLGGPIAGLTGLTVVPTVLYSLKWSLALYSIIAHPAEGHELTHVIQLGVLKRLREDSGTTFTEKELLGRISLDRIMFGIVTRPPSKAKLKEVIQALFDDFQAQIKQYSLPTGEDAYLGSGTKVLPGWEGRPEISVADIVMQELANNPEVFSVFADGIFPDSYSIGGYLVDVVIDNNLAGLARISPVGKTVTINMDRFKALMAQLNIQPNADIFQAVLLHELTEAVARQVSLIERSGNQVDPHAEGMMAEAYFVRDNPGVRDALARLWAHRDAQEGGAWGTGAASYDGNTPLALVQKATHTGRNTDVTGILINYLGQLTDLRLDQGRPVVVDVGTGALPVTTSELAQVLKKINPNLSIIGTELPQAVAKAHISSVALLENFRRQAAAALGFMDKDILDLILSVDNNDQPLEIIAKVKFADSSIGYKTLAVTPNAFVKTNVGLITENKANNDAFFRKVIDFLGESNIKRALNNEQVDGILLEHQPAARMLEGAGARLEVTDDPQAIKEVKEQGGATVITVNNVTMHMNPQELEDFRQKMQGALKDGGILVIKNSPSGPETRETVGRSKNIIEILRKDSGRLVSLGIEHSDVDSSELMLFDRQGKGFLSALAQRRNDILDELSKEQNLRALPRSIWTQLIKIFNNIDLSDQQFKEQCRGIIQESFRLGTAASQVPPASAMGTEDSLRDKLRQDVEELKGDTKLNKAFRASIEVALAITGGFMAREWGLDQGARVKWHDYTHVANNTHQMILALQNFCRANPQLNIPVEAILLAAIAGMYHDVGYYTIGPFGTIKVDHEVQSMQFVREHAKELSLDNLEIVGLVCLVISASQSTVPASYWNELEILVKNKNTEALRVKLLEFIDAKSAQDVAENKQDLLLGLIYAAKFLSMLDVRDTREDALERIEDLRLEFLDDYRILMQQLGVVDVHNPADITKEQIKEFVAGIVAVKEAAVKDKVPPDRVQSVVEEVIFGKSKSSLSEKDKRFAVKELLKIVVSLTREDAVANTAGFYKDYVDPERVNPYGDLWERYIDVKARKGFATELEAIAEMILIRNYINRNPKIVTLTLGDERNLETVRTLYEALPIVIKSANKNNVNAMIASIVMAIIELGWQPSQEVLAGTLKGHLFRIAGFSQNMRLELTRNGASINFVADKDAEPATEKPKDGTVISGEEGEVVVGRVLTGFDPAALGNKRFQFGNYAITTAGNISVNGTVIELKTKVDVYDASDAWFSVYNVQGNAVVIPYKGRNVIVMRGSLRGSNDDIYQNAFRHEVTAIFGMENVGIDTGGPTEHPLVHAMGTGTARQEQVSPLRRVTYQETARQVRRFVGDNAQYFKDKRLSFTCEGNSYEVLRRLTALGIKADIYYVEGSRQNSLGIKPGDWHVWVKAEDGCIIDAYPYGGGDAIILDGNSQPQQVEKYQGELLNDKSKFVSVVLKWEQAVEGLGVGMVVAQEGDATQASEISAPLDRIAEKEDIKNILVFSPYGKNIFEAKLGETIIDIYALVAGLHEKFPNANIYVSTSKNEIFFVSQFKGKVIPVPLDPLRAIQEQKIGNKWQQYDPQEWPDDFTVKNMGTSDSDEARLRFLASKKIDMVFDVSRVPYMIEHTLRQEKLSKALQYYRPHLFEVVPPTSLPVAMGPHVSGRLRSPYYIDRSGNKRKVAGFEAIFDSQALNNNLVQAGLWKLSIGICQALGISMNSDTFPKVILQPEEAAAGWAWLNNNFLAGALDSNMKTVVINVYAQTQEGLLSEQEWAEEVILPLMQHIKGAYFIFTRGEPGKEDPEKAERIVNMMRYRANIEDKKIVLLPEATRDIYPYINAILGMADFVVTLDTGLSHLASGVYGVPTLILNTTDIRQWETPRKNVFIAPVDMLKQGRWPGAELKSGLKRGMEFYADRINALPQSPQAKRAKVAALSVYQRHLLDENLLNNRISFPAAEVDVREFIEKYLADLKGSVPSFAAERIVFPEVAFVDSAGQEASDIPRFRVKLHTGENGKTYLLIDRSTLTGDTVNEGVKNFDIIHEILGHVLLRSIYPQFLLSSRSNESVQQTGIIMNLKTEEEILARLIAFIAIHQMEKIRPGTIEKLKFLQAVPASLDLVSINLGDYIGGIVSDIQSQNKIEDFDSLSTLRYREVLNDIDRVDEIIGRIAEKMPEIKKIMGLGRQRVGSVEGEVAGRIISGEGEGGVSARIISAEEGGGVIDKTLVFNPSQLTNLIEEGGWRSGNYTITSSGDVVIGEETVKLKIKLGVLEASEEWFSAHNIRGNAVVVDYQGRRAIILRQGISSEARHEAFRHELNSILGMEEVGVNAKFVNKEGRIIEHPLVHAIGIYESSHKVQDQPDTQNRGIGLSDSSHGEIVSTEDGSLFAKTPNTFERARVLNNGLIPEDSIKFLTFVINEFFNDALPNDASVYGLALYDAEGRGNLSKEQFAKLEQLLPEDIMKKIRVYQGRIGAYDALDADVAAMGLAVSRCLNLAGDILSLFDRGREQVKAISPDASELIDALTYLRDRAAGFFDELKKRSVSLKDPLWEKRVIFDEAIALAGGLGVVAGPSDFEETRIATEKLSALSAQRVMVVGRGIPHLAVALALVGKDVVFVDVDNVAIETMQMLVDSARKQIKKNPISKLNENFKLQIIKGEIGELALAKYGLVPGSFDMVTLIDLYGPKPKGKPQMWFAKAAELLKDGGYLLVDQDWLFVDIDAQKTFLDQYFSAVEEIDRITGNYGTERSNALLKVNVRRPGQETPTVVNLQRDNKGGIDFRTLPITIKPMPGMAPGLLAPGALAMNISKDKEWGEIENMLNGGIIPSMERIKELLSAATSSKDYAARIGKALNCIAQILRIEEDSCSGTDLALKQVLVLLESNKSEKDLKLALAGIMVLEKEPQLVVQ